MKHEKCIYHIPFANNGIICLSPEDSYPVDCKCEGCKWFQKKSIIKDVKTIADQIIAGYFRIPGKLLPSHPDCVLRFPTIADEKEASILAEIKIDEEDFSGKKLKSETEIRNLTEEFALSYGLPEKAREKELVLKDCNEKLLSLLNEDNNENEDYKNRVSTIINIASQELKELEDVKLLLAYRNSLGLSREAYYHQLKSLYLIYFITHRCPARLKGHVKDYPLYWQSLDDFLNDSPKAHNILLIQVFRMQHWLNVDF